MAKTRGDINFLKETFHGESRVKNFHRHLPVIFQILGKVYRGHAAALSSCSMAQRSTKG